MDNTESAQNGVPEALIISDADELAVQPRVVVIRYDELRKTLKGNRKNRVHPKNALLIVRRCIDEKGQLAKILVDVMSPMLREILRNSHGCHVNISDVEPEVARDVLFHARKQFREKLNEELSKTTPDKNIVFELQAMVDFIEEEYRSTIADVDRLLSEGRITYAFLWARFPTGCLVYRRHPQLDQHQVMRHKETKYTQDGFSIVCDIISNDGKHFGLAKAQDIIEPFISTVKIQDLKFLPLVHHPDHEEIGREVVVRGKKFSKLGQQLFETSGVAFQEIWGSKGRDTRNFTANGRVMIDPKGFSMFQPDNKFVNLSVYHPLENRDDLTDDERRICSPVALGFCFGNKKWGGFALENLQEVIWSDTAFDCLVLEKHKKRVICSLIQQHCNRKLAFDDVIAGKGQGLVGLLSGNPGCGKTLTGEAVAEVARMPLYVVGAGDLGVSAEDVDEALLQIFEIAARWDAVVLLDEADVFLHKRTALALKQNALVAVFLRHLEYYKGILIMTTNMDNDFDPAFESRSYLALKIIITH
ncbi:hypothetical protein H0H87_005357 [Tephrocybe sp. NHM501043]|nr:hypothetical protein H0H87_005357 [Tephrocybe sp. NHM501043]